MSLLSPLRAFVDQLTYPARTHPWKFSIIFTSAKTGLADYLTQTQLEKCETFDYRRNAVFWVFGAWFLGGFQYAAYVHGFTRMFPAAARFTILPPREKLKDYAGQRAVVGQVTFDMLIFEPFIYFPCFYQTKGWLNGQTPLEAHGSWRKNVVEDVVAFWSVGIPAFTFNFAFCPLWMRVPFVGVYSLFWTTYLSYKRGKADAPTP
ncbi:hypothetical protein M885DRAFT_444356 [Pelagophyceae sp. CCMP2097]|nr:hypothetical protein M885DRAFT_444356 [Pelagophyceae sp. CCMP2097]|mmetsp:Transcript_18138/g.61148  ORF Transcript_18138/g.61148 Transcript_18138/m.61148 type:complete len:205 (-) Transcript_18138:78-692(-)